MPTKLKTRSHFPLFIALAVSACLFACGADFGADRGIPEERDYRDKVKCGIEDRNVEFLQTIPELEGVPTEYRRFLEANADVLANLIWVNGEYPEGRIFIEEADRVRDLTDHLNGRVRIEAPPIPVKSESDVDTYYTEEDAWNIYLAHVAHALEVEVHKLVPWSLSGYTREELALLFDGRYLFAYSPSEGLYRFSSKFPGGRQRVTDWSPVVGYEFLRQHGMIGTQAETVFRFTNWLRRNLVHSHTGTPENWDGYTGYPPVDKILAPPEGHRHWTQGCAGTTSLYIAVLQAVNIPVVRGASRLATQGGPEQLHHRVEFPLLGIGLAHADDAHNELYRRGVNEIPVEELFYTFEELNELIDEPRIDEGAPSRGEQSSYNMFTRAIGSAYHHMADSVLKRRARDLLGSGDNTTEDLLMARICSPSPCFWKSPFDSGEILTMIEKMDAALSQIGSGDILEGSRIVLRR